MTRNGTCGDVLRLLRRLDTAPMVTRYGSYGDALRHLRHSVVARLAAFHRRRRPPRHRRLEHRVS